MQDAATSIPVLFWLIPLGTAVIGYMAGYACGFFGCARQVASTLGADVQVTVFPNTPEQRRSEAPLRKHRKRQTLGYLLDGHVSGPVDEWPPYVQDTPEQRARAGQ